MQPQDVYGSDLYLYKFIYQDIFVSYDLAPDIYPVQGIT